MTFVDKLIRDYEVIARIITDRERAERMKKHAKEIMTRRPAGNPAPAPRSAPEANKPSFLKVVKDKKDDKAFQEELKQAKQGGTIELYVDIYDSGTVHSGKKPMFKKTNVQYADIKTQAGFLLGKFEEAFNVNDDFIEWTPGSDGKDGTYTGDSFEVDHHEVPWKFFDKALEKAYDEEEPVEIYPVLKLKFKKLTGNELK